ncbi:hypothetical protein ACFSUI_18430 [Ralstonia solanacearum]
MARESGHRANAAPAGSTSGSNAQTGKPPVPHDPHSPADHPGFRPAVLKIIEPSASNCLLFSENY